MSYSSLHNHSYYSIQDGYGSVEEYFERAKEVGLKAIALTEHGNAYSSPYVHKVRSKYPEIKVLYGCEFYEAFDHTVKDPDNKYFHLLVLCRDEDGRKAVNKLITLGEFEGKYYKPRIDLEQMKPYADHLIVTTACLASKLSREKDYQKCVEYVNEYKSIFNKGNFFLEMQSHRSEDQAEYNRKILKLVKDTDTPFIITTDSHAARKEQLKYQGIFIGISQDREVMDENYEGCYMQSVDEIHEIMDEQIGREYVILGLETTNYIADMVEDIQQPFGSPKLPPFPIPEGYTYRTYMEKLLKDGWFRRGFDKMSAEEQKVRKERTEYELNIIDKMGFMGYFLILEDAMSWGRKNGILFGDGGRGSGAGSMVCFLLGLTGLDPVRYGLIFERFLNPERVSYPDLDVDCEPRGSLIEYLQGKYGKMSVCQIANFSTISPTVAIQDTARILDKDPKRLEKFGKTIGVKKAREISKLFNYSTWEECIEKNSFALEKYDEEIFKELFEVAQQMSGRVRHCSIHAGGVGIVDGEVSDILPMRLTDKGEQVIGADKVIAEECSVVKMDLLGLSNLAIIQGVLSMTGIDHWEIDPTNESFITDEAAYDLIGRGETDSVFQLESKGMIDLCVKLKPKDLLSLSDILALFRPDVIQAGMLDDYVNRKTNGAKIEYVHPDMEKILGRTYGVQIYQEQSMEITRVFGGRSYGGADTLRKIIGKKQVEKVKPEIAKLRQEIIDNGYSKKVSDSICDVMEGFGSYSFNLSHSVGYSVISLQTAYLKAHYPVEFYASALNACNSDNSKINKKVTAAQKFGVAILPPHINNSSSVFSVTDGKILFGLSAVTGVGKVAEKIIEERNKNGAFTGVVNLMQRVPELNTKQIVHLIKAGAFGKNTDKALLLSKFLKYTANQKFGSAEYKPYKDVKTTPTLLVLKTEYGIETKDKEERLRLYNEVRRKAHETVEYEKWKAEQAEKRKKEYNALWEKYSDNQEYWEYEAISIFLSNNPFKEVYSYIQRPFNAVEENQEFFDVGIISKITKKKDKNKNTYCYINIYSYNGIIEGVCFATVYNQFIDLIAKGNKVAIFGERSGEDTFVVKNIETIDNWLERSNIKLGK